MKVTSTSYPMLPWGTVAGVLWNGAREISVTHEGASADCPTNVMFCYYGPLETWQQAKGYVDAVLDFQTVSVRNILGTWAMGVPKRIWSELDGDELWVSYHHPFSHTFNSSLSGKSEDAGWQTTRLYGFHENPAQEQYRKPISPDGRRFHRYRHEHGWWVATMNVRYRWTDAPY